MNAEAIMAVFVEKRRDVFAACDKSPPDGQYPRLAFRIA